MQVTKFENEQEWLEARRGRITGTRLKDLVNKRGTKPKKGYYELIAERVALPANQENVMDRGHRLEVEALERFEKETGKKVNKDLVIISREDNPDIAYSPDGYRGLTETMEVKCLNSASHIEAWLTQQIPSEYEEQVVQPFIVNDKLKTLYFIFYDPRMPKDFFYFTFTRAQLEKEIEEYLELERRVLAEIKEIEDKLTF